MKLDKRYIKFFETGNNKYYLLPFQDELHIVTESFLPMNKKFLRKNNDLVQGIKLLELTAPISMLFQEMLNMDVDKKDEEFPDMTTYKKVDNLKLRTTLEQYYIDAMNDKIELMKVEFEEWLARTKESMPNATEETLRNIESTNRQRLEKNIITVKENSPLNHLYFKWKTGDNLIVKKMLDNNMEYLYTQKIGSNYKIHYVYDLDIFGVVTIYKIHCVKDTLKTIETFIYNREIIQELVACMANNNL